MFYAAGAAQVMAELQSEAGEAEAEGPGQPGFATLVDGPRMGLGEAVMQGAATAAGEHRTAALLPWPIASPG